MDDVYYSPEKFGLTTVGEIDWSDGCYNFSLTVVWRREDGTLVYGEDSGCSCPSPFEDQGISDLTACTPAELQAHLDGRVAADEYYGEGDPAAHVADLMHKVMTAILVPGSVVPGQADGPIRTRPDRTTGFSGVAVSRPNTT